MVPPPEHPHRPPRLEQLFSNLEPFYFVTFNTYKRLPLLARPEIHDVFREFCVRAQDHNVAVGRYVLMPDHIHLFVFIPEHETTLEKWVQSLRSVIGKRLLELGIEKLTGRKDFSIICCAAAKAIRKNGNTCI
jgi:REP element-mobilizing transposase RayT